MAEDSDEDIVLCCGCKAHAGVLLLTLHLGYSSANSLGRRKPIRRSVLLAVLIFLLVQGGAGAAAASQDSARHGGNRQLLEALRQARLVAPLDTSLQRRTADACLELGLELLAAESLVEAFAIFLEGRELAPEDPRFPFHLGHVRYRQGSLDEAETYVLEALRKGAPPAETSRLLARILYGQGRLYEAQSLLTQALAQRPDEDSHRFLARIERELAIEANMGNRHSGNFQISYVAGGEQLGDDTLEVLREAYAELGTLFNTFPAPAVSVILYGNRDFAAVTGAPEWAGGAFDGKIRVPVGGLRTMNVELRRILYHEYAHVLVFSLTGGNVPRWLDEGLAQMAEMEAGSFPAAHLRQSAEPAALLPFARLERSFAGLSSEEAAAAYLQTRAFTNYLLERYGWPRMLDLLQALGSGRSFSAAVDVLLYAGEDFLRIREAWEREEGLVFSRALQ